MFSSFDLRPNGSLANKRNRNTNSPEQKRLLSPNSINQEKNEDQIRDGSNAIVDSRDEEVPVSCDTEVLVHDGLVVADHVDTGHLREELHEGRLD